jgi:hypothetical protein
LAARSRECDHLVHSESERLADRAKRSERGTPAHRDKVAECSFIDVGFAGQIAARPAMKNSRSFYGLDVD